DLVEALLGGEAERAGAFGIEPARPALDDAGDQRVVLAADARRNLWAGNAGERRDLLGDGAAHARQRQIDAVAERLARQTGGVNQKADRGARAGMGVHD